MHLSNWHKPFTFSSCSAATANSLNSPVIADTKSTPFLAPPGASSASHSAVYRSRALAPTDSRVYAMYRATPACDNGAVEVRLSMQLQLEPLPGHCQAAPQLLQGLLPLLAHLRAAQRLVQLDEAHAADTPALHYKRCQQSCRDSATPAPHLWAAQRLVQLDKAHDARMVARRHRLLQARRHHRLELRLGAQKQLPLLLDL